MAKTGARQLCLSLKIDPVLQAWRRRPGGAIVEAMAVLDQVRDFVASMAPMAACDDCIADRLKITPRQHANRKTRELEKTRAFARGVGEFALCKRTDKKVIRHA
jgi:hypothetical protein